MSDAQTLFRAGELRAAIEAQTAAVRAVPGSLDARYFLAELLCLAGERDRADRQLDTLAAQAGDPRPNIAVFRQLLRGEETRRQVLLEGRAPELLGPSSGTLASVAETLLLLRLGEDAQAAVRIASQADAAVPVSGRRNGAEFHDFRDLDDVLAPLVEILGADGGYRWVAVPDISRIELQPLAHPRDLVWRPAHIVLRSGLQGDVWLPCLYVSADLPAEDGLRLGRRTEWQEEPEGVVRGVGLRSFLVGEEDVPLHELGTIDFDGVA